MSIKESELLLNSYKYETNNYFSKNNSPIQQMKNKIIIIKQCIDKLEQPYKSVLTFRYINNLSYMLISCKLHYSVQRIYQLRKKAIILFCEQIEILQKQNWLIT